MRGLQVLVASSDAARRDALAEILVRCGLRPLTTTSVSGVRAMFDHGPVHLVFSEDDLPEGGFHEVLRLAATMGQRIPVVVCSRHGDLDEYLEAMQSGAFDFIAPPFSPAEIRFIVSRAPKPLSARHQSRSPYTEAEPVWFGGKSAD